MCLELDNLKINPRSYYNLPNSVSLKILNLGLILKIFTHIKQKPFNPNLPLLSELYG